MVQPNSRKISWKNLNVIVTKCVGIGPTNKKKLLNFWLWRKKERKKVHESTDETGAGDGSRGPVVAASFKRNSGEALPHPAESICVMRLSLSFLSMWFSVCVCVVNLLNKSWGKRRRGCCPSHIQHLLPSDFNLRHWNLIWFFLFYFLLFGLYRQYGIYI